MYNVLLIIATGRLLAVNILDIWLSGIFPVVKFAVKGTILEPVLDIKCNLYPISHPLYY